MVHINQKIVQWKWLAIFILGILLWLISNIVTGIILKLIYKDSSDLSGLPILIYAVLTFNIIFFGLYFLYKLFKENIKDIGLIFKNWQIETIIGLIIGISYALLNIFIIIPLMGGKDNQAIIASKKLIGNTPFTMIGMIIVGWIAGGIREEIFFRGHIITSFKNFFKGKQWAIIVIVFANCIYFGYSHAYQGWEGMIHTGITALLYSVIYLWRKNLVASIVSHGIYDMLTIIGIFYLFS